MIGIINYGVGNLQSVKNSLDYLTIPNRIIDKPAELTKCTKIILPGVGAFGPAMEKLNALGFTTAIKTFAMQKPVLGICLGMQLLFEGSEEYGWHQGLGLIAGKVRPFAEKVKDLPLPLIGWNEVKEKKPSPLFENLEVNPCFYFVHSYYAEPADEQTTIGEASYGISFCAVVEQNVIFGCQFHPEKSQAPGLKILENFYKLT